MMDSFENKNLIIRLTCVVSSLLKQWRMVLLIMIICGMGFDIIKTVTYKPLYHSIMQVSMTTDNNIFDELEGTQTYIKTLGYVFNGQVVNKYIEDKLEEENLNMTVSLNLVDNSNVVNMQVISESKAISYHSLRYLVKWYEENMKKYSFHFDIEVLENPRIYESPINSNSHFDNFKTGAILSGAVVIAFIALSAYFKDTVKISDDIKNKIDCRLFAKIPKEIKPRGKKFWIKKKQAILITSLKTSFAYKEAIKKLRSKVEESAKKHGYKSIMITGSLENEGKSSIAANLALSLAQKNYKVLLIDGDIRKPSLHKIFEIKSDKNLNNYLNGTKSWVSQVEYLQKNEFFVICAKADVDHSEQLLTGDKMKTLIQEASKEFDFVLIDTSPACFLNEPLMINEVVDASLLVVKQHMATTYAVNETISRLVNVKNNLIGCIYNASIIDLTSGKKSYGYRYGYNRYNRVKRGS